MTKKRSEELKGAYRTLRVPIGDDTSKPDALKPPEDRVDQMYTLDFSDVEDEEMEAIREMEARAQTPDQETLVAFFEGKTAFSPTLIDRYLKETRQAASNTYLFRRYFKLGNPHLKELLIACIERTPTDHDLLYDLAWLGEYTDTEVETVRFYLQALTRETDPKAFRRLADDALESDLFFKNDRIAALRAAVEGDRERRMVLEWAIDHHRPRSFGTERADTGKIDED